MDIKKFAVEPTKKLHLRDASDELMYSNGDKSKPMVVNLFGPASKQFAKAKAAQSNKIVDRMKRKGKSSQSADQNIAETAEFLSGCTESWENVEYQGITETNALSHAIYSDPEIGFIADQVSKELNEWGNFTKPSDTN